MPPLKPARLYWDSDVFIAYFGKDPRHFAELEAILTQVRESQGAIKIVTSMLTKAEVAFIAEEKTAPEKYPNMEAVLDAFWANTRMIELIEVHEDLVTAARRFVRTAFLNHWPSLGAHDAIHLGSAVWVMKHIEVVAFQTYNLRHYEKFRELVPFRIEVPTLPGPTQFTLL